MNTRPTLTMEPMTLAALQYLGRSELPGDVVDLLGEDPYTVAVFSDYSGHAAEAKYEVFASYVVHLNAVQPLLDAIEAVKLRHGISERTIDYKGRKDRRKAAAIEDYVGAFRDHVGACIAICWDKRGRSFRKVRAARAQLAADLGVHAPGVSPSTADRIARALGFLPVIAHLLRERDRLLWISDHDEIFDGAARGLVQQASSVIARDTIQTRLAAFGMATPTEAAGAMISTATALETILTLPDLVAGTLAATLPAPLDHERPLPARDPWTNALLHHLGALRTATRLLVLVFEADMVAQNFKPVSIELGRRAPLVFRQ